MSDRNAFSARLARYVIYAVCILVPFHAFITVYAASITGHYTLLRLWDAGLLFVLVGIVGYWLVRDPELRRIQFKQPVFQLIAVYVALSLLLAAVSYVKADVSLKSLAYGLFSNLRYLIWFLAVAVVAQKTDLQTVPWRRLVLVPAAIVVVFAVLQFTVLPHNFLSHFGYRADTTIAPIETINNNDNYIRVQSTLRGANPFGAYLVIILAAIGLLAVRSKQKVAYVVAGIATAFALYASGSRSAWIGTFLALLTMLWLQLKTKRSKLILGNSFVAALIVLAGVALVFRHNTGLQNALLHTQQHSAVATGSNSAHASALKDGVDDVVQQPFGDGPGTAGPASVYNAPHPSRIAENYYVQVAQETGWLGLGVFLAIVSVVALALYHQVRSSPLALVLFASLIGISFINLLSHAWTDDTLAFLWWGLAGIALVPRKVMQREV